MVKELELPEKVEIHAPPSFESAVYRLELHFENGRELKEKIERLAHHGALDTFSDPWEAPD
jgi:hypothetical protein